MPEKHAALFLVDGEHHPATTLDAVRELEKREGLIPLALYFLGGTEKLKDLSELAVSGVEIIVPDDPLTGMAGVLERLKPQVVVDMSDLPVLGPALRLRLAATTLAWGAVYRGSDFEFRPPRREKVLTKPSCSIMGTGKRCGKTAVSAEMACYLRRKGLNPVVVVMGRGGPAQPYVVEERDISEDFLLSEVSKGLHAASDHYEDALVSGVVTVGSRRCGGGMAGEPFVTNCVEAARLADSLAAEVVIMEGSGSSIPPVATDAAICVISAAQDLEEALGFLGPYKLLISHGVIITMAEEPFASPLKIQELSERIEWINGDIVILKTIFRPHPLKSIRGKRVFLVATAPEEAGILLEDYLEEKEGCVPVGRSHSLSDRRNLEDDLRGAGEAEILLTELKAAAVDVVTRFARDKGKEVVYFHNVPITVGSEMGLDGFFGHIWEEVMK
ncbi:MAG: 2,3-diphosphoglycerate synthetase [Actinobacteria bacterium]|jgi:cyclic 2,3-diphosphoglycerate synthetase|nr:MAG: 2,3-diphosphoglycerate synthetase [Actinomycetota bacterium]